MRTMARMETYLLQIAFWLTLVLGGLALVLTLSGLFSVLSYLVEQRRKEIGVRMALGATTRDVAGLVLSQSVRPVGFGLIAGSGLASRACDRADVDPRRFRRSAVSFMCSIPWPTPRAWPASSPRAYCRVDSSPACRAHRSDEDIEAGVIADVERPAEERRGRYQLRLEEARQLMVRDVQRFSD